MNRVGEVWHRRSITVRSHHSSGASLAVCIGVAWSLFASDVRAQATPPAAAVVVVVEPAPIVPRRSAARRWRVPLILLGTALILTPPAYAYWRDVAAQTEDWELGWDWASWKSKLFTTDQLIFDTNRWEANAVRHPIAGALNYQVGRANQLGVLGSTTLALATAVLWEYVVEYREQVSVNDLVTNTVSAISLGEPMFQLGLLASLPSATWPRRLLAFVASPFDRTQRMLGLSALARQREPWHRLDAYLGAVGARFDAGHRAELQLGLDLAIVTTPSYGMPGMGTASVGPGGRNQIALDVRVGADAPETFHLPGIRFRSSTPLVGRYHRDLDADGLGTDRYVGLDTGLEVEVRRLAAEWDKVSSFHLVAPTLELRWLGPTTTVSWEVSGAADVGMIQAHVFGPVPPFAPEPQTSALRARGYYYGVGGSLQTRLRVERGRWHAGVEIAGTQFWRIDGLDRVEVDGKNDPNHVEDQRGRASLTIGVRPSAGDTRVQLFAESIGRRGTRPDHTRATTEFDGGVRVVTGF